MTETVESELNKYLATTFKACDSPALLIGGDRDHTHALFSLSRTWTVADVVKEVKASSSKWMKSKVGVFQWQGGYGAFSIGQSGVVGVKQYIRDQKEHHRKQSFQDKFRGLCRKYEIEFDEHYVWD
ncbi:MAG TPA: transposase [Blastocatellia bacterium]|nr:transposase [Blastocatellia bacterium]